MNKKIIVSIIVLILIVVVVMFGFSYFINNSNSSYSKEETNSSKESEVIFNSVEIDTENKIDNLETTETEEEKGEFSSYKEEKIKEADKPNLNENDFKSSDVTINVGDYEIRCGKYTGLVQQNGETSEITIEITEDNIIKMNNQEISFSIGTNKLICDYGASFQVTGNNELVYEMGGGIDFSYDE